MRVRVFNDEVAKIAEDPKVADHLAAKLRAVQGGVNPPSGMTSRVRRGVGPRGAFAQLIVRGDGAVAWEWGSVNNSPAGQLRAALNRVR
jgi:hypothetical protein